MLVHSDQLYDTEDLLCVLQKILMLDISCDTNKRLVADHWSIWQLLKNHQCQGRIGFSLYEEKLYLYCTGIRRGVIRVLIGI